MPVPGPLKSLYSFVRVKLITLNLFDSRSTDPAVVRRQIQSTRLFLFLFVISVCILTLYTSLSEELRSETVKQPTQAVYHKLQKKYPETLQCPCAKISIPYGKFVSIAQSFHQVCSSDFVSQSWIDFVFATNTTFVWPMDVRTSLSAMWQLIAALCHSANDTLIDGLDEFANLSLISPVVLSKELLQAKTQVALDLVRRTALDTLTHPLSSIVRVMQASTLMTGLSTNYVAFRSTLQYYEESLLRRTYLFYKLSGSKKYCQCQGIRSCPIRGGLYLYDMWNTFWIYDLNIIIATETLAGIVVDCLPFQMTLASSLECFYNQSCLNILLSAYSRSVDVSILDKTLSSRFVPTTNIKLLIDELFIEQILNETDYNLYYLQCAPIYCSYTFIRRFDWIYVATTLIALSGGISTALRLFIPYLIDLVLFLKKKLRPVQMEPEENESISLRNRLIKLLEKVKRSIVNFNLFDKYSRFPYRIRCGRIATRLYLILIICAINIIIVYTCLAVKTITKRIEFPSQEEYEELELRYPNTLHCPCTNISIPYEEFIQVTPIYHQLCGSDFVQPWWYNSFSPDLLQAEIESIYFTGSSYFQILATLCEIANLTVTAASRGFSFTSFVNAQVLPHRLFLSQTNAIIHAFINSTQVGFLNTVLLINAALQADQYISGISEDSAEFRTMYFPQHNLSGLDLVSVISPSYTIVGENGEKCYCARNASCKKAVISVGAFPLWADSGLVIGCSSLNSVLMSTLNCCYNDTCTNYMIRLHNWSGYTHTSNVTLLNTTQHSRFPPNTPVQDIVNKLMVEEWSSSASYPNFYNRCHPTFCSFTYEVRMHVIYIITTVVGLFGGLDTILRLISFVIVKIFFRCINTATPDNQLQTPSNEETTDREYIVYSKRKKRILLDFKSKKVQQQYFTLNKRISI